VEQVWNLINGGLLPEAEALCRKIIAENGAAGEAQFALAVVFQKRGELAEALEQIQKVLEEDPNAFAALTLGARILFERNEPERALGLLQRSYAIKPGDQAILQMIGRCWTKLGRPIDALQAYEAMVLLEPNQPAGYLGLSEVFAEIGSSFNAAETLYRAAKCAPTKARFQKLANLELGLGRSEQALDAATKVLADDHLDLTANLIAGRLLTEKGELKAAERFWRAAKKSTSDTWRVDRHKAYAYSMIGAFEDSERCLEDSIRSNPRQGSAYQLMFSNRKATEADRERIRSLESLAEESGLIPEEKAPIQFALGKAWDDLGDPERAIRHYDLANAVRLEERNSGKPFSLSEMASHYEMHRRLFPRPSSSADVAAYGKPIFVVGMMRSGTTLLEQILSAHSEVKGAGELDFWPGSEAVLVDSETGKPRLESIPVQRAAYLRLLDSLGGLKKRVVDKNPANIQSAGFIHQIFPESAIICMRRNPVDTAISIWMTDASAPFMSSRRNIVDAIRLVTAQSDHWRRVLPSNRFLDLCYEDLVGDPEKWIRVVLDFCGLPWESACLNANKISNTVRTPSLWQVRQPVYQSSVARWKRYEPWLGEFRELLDHG
jgi:tetratricopeptide (TPR) repeat protein